LQYTPAIRIPGSFANVSLVCPFCLLIYYLSNLPNHHRIYLALLPVSFSWCCFRTFSKQRFIASSSKYTLHMALSLFPRQPLLRSCFWDSSRLDKKCSLVSKILLRECLTIIFFAARTPSIMTITTWVHAVPIIFCLRLRTLFPLIRLGLLLLEHSTRVT